ncbi:L-asparagine transporter-like permease [Paeniglutamicibacter psychrophenolicus]|uniref:L-asparagine transporter-like permease n=1 Tax=Paeniglutamicibacter psychrophenolicus TaxID=257454 RepID=A0ABS4WAS2_9MICC|nr:L-asparagine transporter-like permease [Paeniglutamicibacter psychrophenolicus]
MAEKTVRPQVAGTFTPVTTISGPCFMFVWTIILARYNVYRCRRPLLQGEGRFTMPADCSCPMWCWRSSPAAAGI